MFVRTSSSSSRRRSEADIIRKTRFFHVIDTRRSKILKEICEKKNVFERTETYWLHQRFVLDDEANRRTEKYRSERKVKVSDYHLNQLLDDRNFVQDQHYECQIEHFNL